MSKYGVNEAQRQRIENAYGRHEVRGDQWERYDRLRAECSELAYTVVGETPPSREQDNALEHLEQVLVWANLAIARNEKGGPKMRTFKQGDSIATGGRLYRKVTAVRMWQVHEPFMCESREGALHGQTGDYIAEDGHGGFYPISAAFHAANYEEVE